VHMRAKKRAASAVPLSTVSGKKKPPVIDLTLWDSSDDLPKEPPTETLSKSTSVSTSATDVCVGYSRGCVKCVCDTCVAYDLNGLSRR